MEDSIAPDKSKLEVGVSADRFKMAPSTPKPKKSLLMKIRAEASMGLKSPAVHIPATPYLKKLGYGTGVSVYLYERSPKAGAVMSPWAVKRVNKRHENTQFATRLEEEAKILRTLSHPHIIGYRGFQKTDSGPKNLVMEDGHKALLGLIEARKEEEYDIPFPAEAIEKVIKWGAEALDYLHTEKQIMHGDLKSANILVVGDFENIKLCDFGVTLPVNSEGRVSDPDRMYIGTDAWSPMEAVQDLPITTKADIFAFGLVVFEMLALHPPHIDKLGGESFDNTFSGFDDSLDSEASFDDSAYKDALGTRPALPDHLDLDESYKKVLEAFFAMTMEDPLKRPSAKELCEMMAAEDTDDSVLCVNIVEGSTAAKDNKDDSVICVDIVEAPSAL